MFENLRNKRLLVLGSTELISVIVKKAKAMGVYTIVTDNRPYENAPAKRIADKYYNISFSDIPEMVKLVKDEKIDGIMTGFTDSYMEYYLKICEEAGLPCYGGKKQFLIATDKAEFKKACIESGVSVIPGEMADDYEKVLCFCQKNGYPVMLKPVDNSGSRGVVKCESEDRLEEAFSYAMSFSSVKEVIVEKYMDCENIAVSYFACDGEIKLSTTDDRMIYKSEETGSSVSSYSEYPSVYTERYKKDMNEKVINMLKSNGFREGLISLQTFVDKDDFYMCEMCYRLSGGQHYLLVEDQYGIDQLALQIEFALTGSCKGDWDMEKEDPCFEDRYAMLRIIGVPDKKIYRLEGFSDILADDNVIKCNMTKHAGDVIGKDGTTAQVLGSILYKFSKDCDKQAAADEIFSRLKIEDEDGNSIAFISID